jgi:hypothetical protein
MRYLLALLILAGCSKSELKCVDPVVAFVNPSPTKIATINLYDPYPVRQGFVFQNDTTYIHYPEGQYLFLFVLNGAPYNDTVNVAKCDTTFVTIRLP